jgi:hypothetical protein
MAAFIVFMREKTLDQAEKEAQVAIEIGLQRLSGLRLCQVDDDSNKVENRR